MSARRHKQSPALARRAVALLVITGWFFPVIACFAAAAHASVTYSWTGRTTVSVTSLPGSSSQFLSTICVAECRVAASEYKVTEQDQGGALPYQRDGVLGTVTRAQRRAMQNEFDVPLIAKAAYGADAERDDSVVAAQIQIKSKSVRNSQANAGEVKTKKKVVRLFRTVDFRSVLKDMPKWERVLQKERATPSFTPDGISCDNASVAARWKALQNKLSGASLLEKIKGVNKFFNQWPYRTDIAVWGVEDYWATPCEFIVRSGDCEDYAITKYFALRALGVPADIMRIAAVKDTIRGIGHAVLVIYMDNDAYVLDNLSNLVLSHKRLRHYSPLYSLNENYLWRHVKPIAGPDSN